MGTVEDFQPNKQSRSTENTVAPAGEIIIFPGVRRERHSTTDGPEGPKKKRTKPKRDRIEIPD